MNKAVEPPEDPRDTLSMWTVYDRPTDYPTGYIARRHAIRSGGSFATSDVIKVGGEPTDLAILRAYFLKRGLTCMTRSAGDDPKIVETWF